MGVLIKRRACRGSDSALSDPELTRFIGLGNSGEPCVAQTSRARAGPELSSDRLSFHAAVEDHDGTAALREQTQLATHGVEDADLIANLEEDLITGQRRRVASGPRQERRLKRNPDLGITVS